MIEITKNLFIGNQFDYEKKIKHQKDWLIIQACKEPYHRKALGYFGRGAPKDHPEYLIAVRKNRLILNLIDSNDYKYIPVEIINKAINFIEKNINNKKILVHCNQGDSRAPSIGLIYMIKMRLLNISSLDNIINDFKKIYPFYDPTIGFSDFIKFNWNSYLNF